MHARLVLYYFSVVGKRRGFLSFSAFDFPSLSQKMAQDISHLPQQIVDLIRDSAQEAQIWEDCSGNVEKSFGHVGHDGFR